MRGTAPHLTDYRPPGGRLPPPEVVALLREVDPAAELIYVGKGRWMLGTVRQDRELQAKAVKAIGAYLTVLTFAAPAAHAHVDPGSRPGLELTKENRAELNYRLWLKLLQRQGFRKVCTFHQNMPDSHFAEAFRAGDWTWRNRAAAKAVEEREIKKSEGDQDLEARQAAVTDYLQAEGRSLHRKIFRGRTQVQKAVDGFTGHTHIERRSAS